MPFIIKYEDINMYNYSPISKLHIRNFRNLGDVTLDFAQSPIITLVGENEAGKTSVIKAFTTCALHACPKDQKDYIRDGTKMFGVAIDLEDGHRITRIKELSGINSYQIKDASGAMIYSTNKLAEGLPMEVQKLMGLIEEPETKEFLHVRTYEDKLLFVVTPNSTNYKVMYNALKIEQLTKAIKIGSNEVNTLRNIVNNNEVSINTLQNQIRDITIFDLEPLVNVRERLKEQVSTLNKITRAKQMLDQIEQLEVNLGALALLDKFNLQPINIMLADGINKAYNKLNDLVGQNKLLQLYSDIGTAEDINISVASKIYNIIGKYNELDTKISEAGALVHLAEISEISEIEAMHLSKVKNLVENLTAYEDEYKKHNVEYCAEVTDNDINIVSKLVKMSQLIDSQENNNKALNEINDYIVKMDDYLKQCGVAVETCPKCGEAVIFDVDKM